jgi:hypothetical protein
MKTLPKLNSIKDIKRLNLLGVVIEFDPQEEDISPNDSFFDNEEWIQKITDRYNNGDLSAWFCAHVIVKYKGLEADDYLGCCSYSSFNDFLKADKDYYFDMINQCIAEINKDIIFANSETQKFWNIRKAANLIKPYGLFIVSTLNIHPVKI